MDRKNSAAFCKKILYSKWVVVRINVILNHAVMYKSGEIMNSAGHMDEVAQIDGKSGGDVDLIPNFRVFGTDSTQPVYGNPLGVAADSEVYLPIFLVSIMSSFYQNITTLEYMMSKVIKKYPLNTPILNVCGDTVYRNTEYYLFKSSKTRDPVQKGRESWELKYYDILSRLDSVSSNSQKLVNWEYVKLNPCYIDAKKFTDFVFSSNFESMKDYFSIQDDSVYDALIYDIEKSGILQRVSQIADEFTAKNSKKLKKRKKQIDGKKKLAEEIYSILKARDVEIKQTNAPAEERVYEAEFLAATAAYLAEEYAVFLVLSSLRFASDASFLSEQHLLSTPARFKPVLHYPVSSTKGSELIFTTFRVVEALYIKYSQCLNLFEITEPVTLLDLVVPEEIHPHKILSENINSLDSSEENNVSSVSVIVPYGDTDTGKHGSQSALAAGATIIPSTSTRPSFFHRSDISSLPIANEQAKAIARRIVEMIDAHIRVNEDGSGNAISVKTKIKYKNGVNCDLNVERSADAKGLVLSGERNSSREKITGFLCDAVCILSGSSDDVIETNIQYNGYDIYLTMSLPSPPNEVNVKQDKNSALKFV